MLSSDGSQDRTDKVTHIAALLSQPVLISQVRNEKKKDWGMEDLELDACCLDEMKFNFRIMDELDDLNLESVDDI